MKTKQELFNTAYLGLKSQGFQESQHEWHCMYRGPNGLRCALGWCIPDDRYHPAMDHSGVDFREVMEIAGVAPEDYQFAMDLQNAHDMADDPKHMEARLRCFAAKYNLTIPEPQGEAR